MSHFNLHGDLSDFSAGGPNFILKNLCSTGTIANITFVIITGYFMVKSKPNYKKVIGLILDMIFYSYVIFAILYASGVIQIGGKDLIRTVFPMLFGNWFCIHYICLYFFIPVLNYILNGMSKRDIEKTIFIMFVLISVIPTFTTAFEFSKHAAFILAYFVGGYIRLFMNQKNNIKIVTKILLLDIAAIIFLISGMIYAGLYLQNEKIIAFSSHFLTSNDSIFAIIFAICLFFIFKNLKIKNNNIINGIAASVLGIYLIHDNVYMRPLIWTKIIPNNLYFDKWCFFAFAITKILVVFLICLVIDRIRIIVFGKLRKSIVEVLYAFAKKISEYIL